MLCVRRSSIALAAIRRRDGLWVPAGTAHQRVGATGCNEPRCMNADQHTIGDQQQNCKNRGDQSCDPMGSLVATTGPGALGVVCRSVGMLARGHPFNAVMDGV